MEDKLLKNYAEKHVKTEYYPAVKGENGHKKIVTNWKFFEILRPIDWQEIADLYEDDFETAYYNGVNHSFDELWSIEVDKVIRALKEKISTYDSDDEWEIEQRNMYNCLIDKLEKAKGWEMFYNYIPKELKTKQVKRG